MKLQGSGAQVQVFHTLACLPHGHMLHLLQLYMCGEWATVLPGYHVDLWCWVAHVTADAAIVSSPETISHAVTAQDAARKHMTCCLHAIGSC